MARTGPLVIAYDGSSASKLAVDEAGGLFPGDSALVVHVWEAGAAYAAVTDATELPVIDSRTAPDLDEAEHDAARLTAHAGADTPRRVGLDAEALVVADEGTVPETLLRVASERDARAIMIGSHGHHALRERLLGSTTQSVIKSAACPVVVVRHRER